MSGPNEVELETVDEQFKRLNKQRWPCHYHGARGHWYVVAGQSRDSKLLEKCNFEAFRKVIDDAHPQGDDGESSAIERASHWACGWVDSLLLNPDYPTVVRAAKECLAEMENYPILDERAYSEAEHEAMCEYWDGMSLRERIRLCAYEGVSILAARRDYWPDEVHEKLSQWVNE